MQGDTNSVLNICSSKINLVGRAPQEALMNPRETIELTDLEKMAILREAVLSWNALNSNSV